MNPVEICQNCKQKFNSRTYKKTSLEDGSVVNLCANCGQKNLIIEKAKCDWPFFIEGPWGMGPTCNNSPNFVFPHKTLSGVKYRCLCRTHLLYVKHSIPMTAIISEETKKIIDQELLEGRPAYYSFVYAWMFFVAICGPLMLLYALLGYKFSFAKQTFFSFAWMSLGMSWLILIKTKIINARLSFKTKKRILWIWIILLVIIRGLEFIYLKIYSFLATHSQNMYL